jgi:CheY-like chemotaxis protein
MESIGTLAGGIAHDFNNILSSIIGFSELSLSEAPEGSELHDDIREILAAGHRARDLVRQILLFSRHEKIEIKPMQLKSVVTEAFKLLRSSIPSSIEKNITVESDELVLGDPSQFHQIIMNLCTNASHALQDQRGFINIFLKDITLDSEFVISHSDLRPGPHVMLSIEDTGVGISKKNISKIFDPFFTTKEREKGTGLGLSVVHGIVKAFKGGIYVYSEQGNGTVFKLYFPALKKHGEQTTVQSGFIPLGTERILIVDDEKSIAKMGCRILESLGYDPTPICSSEKALTLFKSDPGKFDLVITDMTMPRMTGDILAQELMAVRPDIPVILCTGYNQKLSEETIKKTGIKALINKPFIKAEFARIIRLVLDSAEMGSVKD